MSITGQIRTPISFGEALLADWQAAGLIKESALKPVFTTIEHGLVIRKLGALSERDQQKLRELIAVVTGG